MTVRQYDFLYVWPDSGSVPERKTEKSPVVLIIRRVIMVNRLGVSRLSPL